MKVFYLPAASVLLFAAVVFFPSLGGFFLPFSPLLLLFYFADPSRDKMSDIAFVALLGVCAAFEPYISLYYAVSVVFTAFIIIMYFGKEESNWRPVVLAPLPSFLISTLVIFFSESIRNNIVGFIKNMFEAAIESAKSAPQDSGMSVYISIVEKNIDIVSLGLVLIFPGMIFFVLLLTAFFNKTVFYKIRKAGHEVFRIPDNYVWVMLAGLAFFFSANIFMRAVALNTVLVFGGLYLLQGFEVLRHWIYRFKIAGVFKLLIYILVFSEPPLMAVLALVGLFSIWFDFFRKTEINTTTEN